MMVLKRLKLTQRQRHVSSISDDIKKGPSGPFFIHITGPWNGPLSVSHVTENSFRVVTIAGHLETGEKRTIRPRLRGN